MFQLRCRDAVVIPEAAGLCSAGDRNNWVGMMGQERLRYSWMMPGSNQ